MFGMGGSEILVILIVALLFLGPDKLPEAAKQISKGIRDIKKQSRVLTRTIEDDEHIGGAIRDLKSALRGEDEPIRPPPIRPREVIETTAVAVALQEPGASDPGSTEAAEAQAADAPPALRMPPTAGEPDGDAPASADDDDALAAMVKPAPDTIARSAGAPVDPSDPSEPKHG